MATTKRKFRYENTGAKKAKRMFHARLNESRENLRVIAQLHERRPEEREFVFQEEEGEEGEMPTCSRQAQDFGGAPVAGEHVGYICEGEPGAFDELSQSNTAGDEEEPLSLSDRVLYYAMYVEHFGLSKEEVKRMEKLIGVICGKPPPFTYQEKVLPLKKEILSEYDPKRLIFCIACKGKIGKYRDMCENQSCSLYRCHLKRAKGVQRSEVHLINMVPQLSDLLEREVRGIIDFHRQLHENGGGPASNRSDVRFFHSFYQGIESAEEFNRNRIKVVLSLSIDGFVPKRLTRREVWPLYMRVDNLHKSVANKYSNSILCGVFFSLSKPSSEMIESLFSRLESELRSLENDPLIIDVDGVCWTVTVQINRGIADMGAQRALFGLPHWESSQGCSKCYIPGERIGNHRVWISREGDDVTLRSFESFIEDGENRTNGIPGVTPVMRIVRPSQFMSDALHVCSEGVTKDRLRDMVSTTGKFPALKLTRQAVDSLKDCLMHITSHTYSPSIVHSLEILNLGKAKEIDELAFIVFPLSASAGIIPSPIAAVSLMGYWLCLRIIREHRSLTTEKIAVAQRLAAKTKQIWIGIAPEVFTMKSHWFFDHAMREEIASVGTPYQWSSAPFEGHHARLQVRVDQYTRNRPAAMIDRYLLSKKLRFKFEKRFHASRRSDILELKQKLENAQFNRLPIGILIDDSMYIPANSRVPLEVLQDEHKRWVMQESEDAYSRVVINGKPYSSKEYWRQSLHSRQDMVFIKGNEHGREIKAFASILLFLYNRGTKSLRVLLEEYEFCDPFQHLYEVIQHTEHPLQNVGIELLYTVREHNLFFHELKQRLTRIRPASFIQRSCTYMEYAGRKYASVSD